MEYTVTHDAEADIIVASAQGEWSSATDDAMLKEIIAMIGRTKIRRVLLDIRSLTKIDLSTLRLYDRAQTLQTHRRTSETPTAKVAILFAAPDVQFREGARFFETTARNRGLPYRLFEDRDEAVRWLSAA